MRDEEMFQAAGRAQDWAPLAGTGADARARSVVLRRTRYAGVAGATAAVAVGAVAVAGALGPGNGAGRGGASIVAGSHGTPTAVVSSSAPTAARTTAPVPGTLGAVYERWKSCPDSELTVVNFLPSDPKDLSQRWRDACHRDMATLTALLPGYDVTPALSGFSGAESEVAKYNPDQLKDPSLVLAPGMVPHMGPNSYRIVGKDGTTREVVIRAYGQDEKIKPLTGEEVTLANGMKGWLTLGTELEIENGQPAVGYELYVLDHGRTFYMSVIRKPQFDFEKLVMSPQFGQLITEALAEPES